MSVYIKGMEMPCSCGNCPMVSGFEICDEEKTLISSTRCRRTKKKVKFSERPSDCPLIPVPDHGRLIDADELLALVYANITLFDSTPGRMGADQKLARAWMASMAEDIEEAPTVIPAEEVRHETD